MGAQINRRSILAGAIATPLIGTAAIAGQEQTEIAILYADWIKVRETYLHELEAINPVLKDLEEAGGDWRAAESAHSDDVISPILDRLTALENQIDKIPSANVTDIARKVDCALWVDGGCDAGLANSLRADAQRILGVKGNRT